MSLNLLWGGTDFHNAVMSGYIETTLMEHQSSMIQFRKDVDVRDKFQGKIGESKEIAIPGFLPVVTDPLIPGYDPLPQSYTTENFEVAPKIWASTLDSFIPNTRATNLTYMEDMARLTEQAGRSIDRVIRNVLFRAYLGGHTVATALQASPSTSLHVAGINGFTWNIKNRVRTAVSAANPMAIMIGSSANTVVAATPDDPNYPNAAGTLTLGSATTWSARDSVVSGVAPYIHRVGGGTSVDAIGSGDILTLEDLQSVTARLRKGHIAPHADGTFHVHLDSILEGQLMKDDAFTALLQGSVVPEAIRDQVIGKIAGMTLFRNEFTPTYDNGMTIKAGQAGVNEIGGELINGAGMPIAIRRAIVTGMSAVVESYIPYQEEKVEELQGSTRVEGMQNTRVNGQMLSVDLEGVAYVARPPQDRLGEVVAQTWKLKADWGCPTDAYLETSNSLFKRACIIECA